jgi:cobyrinic acid a,c-diamide synthase
VLGALRRDDAIAAPARHLGLVPAAERQNAARQALDRLAALVSRAVDLEAVVTLAATAGPLAADPWLPSGPQHQPEQASKPVVAIAGGAAFSFSYTETAELLAAAGADVVALDPLQDEALPPGCAALVLGGGFPEVHAADLSANQRLRAGVAHLAGAGAPVVAECAGLLYLARELDGRPMCGVLDATAEMTARLTLGYRDAAAAADSVLGPAGAVVRGHEFHRTAIDPPHSAAPAWQFGDRAEGFVRGSVHASYLHLHWAGYPQLARRVVEAASELVGDTAGAGDTA